PWWALAGRGRSAGCSSLLSTVVVPPWTVRCGPEVDAPLEPGARAGTGTRTLWQEERAEARSRPGLVRGVTLRPRPRPAHAVAACLAPAVPGASSRSPPPVGGGPPVPAPPEVPGCPPAGDRPVAAGPAVRHGSPRRRCGAPHGRRRGPG